MDIKYSAQQKSSLPLSVCMAYSAPYITSTWLASPVGLLQGIYAKYYGLSLTMIAAVILCARVFDSVTDPLIGYCNDRYFRRTGTRKPFLLVGALLCIPSSYCLFAPIDFSTLEMSSHVSVIYFISCFTAFYITSTLFEIPHLAWANELAHSSKDKTKLFSVRTIAFYFGVLLFYAVPLLPNFETTDITPETLRVSVTLASLMMMVFLYIGLRYAPDNCQSDSINQQGDPNDRSRLFAPIFPKVEKIKTVSTWSVFINDFLNNPPFTLFLGAFLFTGLTMGIFYGLFFIYVDSYLGLGALYAQATMLGFLAAIVSVPIWNLLSNTLSKKSSWMLCVVLMLVGFIYIGTLKADDANFYDLLIAIALINSGSVCLWSISPAILAETIDYSSWKYRHENTATYFSLYVFIGKISIALAMSLGIAIVGWYGLDMNAVSHDASGIYGLRLVMVWLPLIFASFALMFIALIPITASRHSIIRRRLDGRIKLLTAEKA